jgi:hypothetical protein
MTRPIKQIGDEIRELTDEEMLAYQEAAATPNPLTEDPKQ